MFCNAALRQARSRNCCSSGKALSVKYFACVCILALVQQHEKRMRRIIIYCQLCPAWLCRILPHHLINGTTFGKNVTEHKICFDFLYTQITGKSLKNCDTEVQNLLRKAVVITRPGSKYIYIHSFIHSVIGLTTGPTPLPKRFLHIVRSRASSFK